MGISIWQLLILLGGFFILILPCAAALFSRKVSGWSKFVWFALSLVFSWVGYLAYYFAKVRTPQDSQELGRIHPARRR